MIESCQARRHRVAVEQSLITVEKRQGIDGYPSSTAGASRRSKVRSATRCRRARRSRRSRARAAAPRRRARAAASGAAAARGGRPASAPSAGARAAYRRAPVRRRRLPRTSRPADRHAAARLAAIRKDRARARVRSTRSSGTGPKPGSRQKTAGFVKVSDPRRQTRHGAAGAKGAAAPAAAARCSPVPWPQVDFAKFRAGREDLSRIKRISGRPFIATGWIPHVTNHDDATSPTSSVPRLDQQGEREERRQSDDARLPDQGGGRRR